MYEIPHWNVVLVLSGYMAKRHASSVLQLAELEASLGSGRCDQQNKDKQKEFDGANPSIPRQHARETIVTAPYEPRSTELAGSMFQRQQDGKLEKDLARHTSHNEYMDFFILTGESGSGKTTMMQHVLKKNYKEGVIFVAVNAG